MRVGVYLSEPPPEAGGSFTFEGDAVAAFLELAPQSAHRFFLLSGSGRPWTLPLPANVEGVRTPPQKRLLGGKDTPKDARRRAAAAALDLGLDLVWAVAAHHPVFEVPYVTVVWDLQHRLQPFFPEVSRDGTWAWREEEHATLLRRAAYVVVGTEAGREEVERFYGVARERIRILPHPTPAFALAPPPPGPLPPLPEGFLLYPAQHWPHKNHAGLLHALALLKARDVEVPLVCVGSDQGNLARTKRLAERLGVAGQVSFLGFVERPVLVALYRAARALAYPSLFGPENLPPLEAFALGCPVLAARVPGAEEQLGDAALLVDATDPAALAEAIRRLWDDAGLRRTLAERGRTRAARWTPLDYVRGVLGVVDGFLPFARTWSDGEDALPPR